jgi:hypothetical protein
MVINLEHVKARAPLSCNPCPRKAPHSAPMQMLVTCEEALIPNSDLPEVAAFAEALSKRLKHSHGVVHARSVDVRPFGLLVLRELCA